MLVALLVVPIMAYAIVGPSNIMSNIEASGVAGGSAAFLSLFSDGGEPYKAVDIISGLAWGLGYCGMPHILVRFMAVKNEKELNKSKGVAIVWVFLSLVFACVIGIVGRAYLYPEVLSGGEEEKVFINMILKLFNQDVAIPLIGGLFL